jgi:cobalamin biosynthesis Co2+ chelatase CbiK
MARSNYEKLLEHVNTIHYSFVFLCLPFPLKMARSNFEKVLEHVNECKRKENLFLLGEVDSTLNGDT